VGKNAVVIESQGVISSQQKGRAKSWILRDQGWVYTLDLTEGVLRGTPLRRWNEERLRQARLARVETHRAEQNAVERVPLRWYYGDRATRSLGRRGHQLAAVPGRTWRLAGRSSRRAPWKQPLLPLVFDGVSLTLAPALSEPLAKLSPRIIEEIPLATGASATVLRRVLHDVRQVSPEALHEGLPERQVAEIEGREKRWREFWVLWRFFEDPETRPSFLDLRGVRIRLEEVAGAVDIPVIRARIRFTEELEEMEELFHLLYVLSPSSCREWYESAIAHGELRRVLSLISVFSLRDPDEAAARIDELLSGSDEFWRGLEGPDQRESRLWLEGVRLWIRTLPEPSVTASLDKEGGQG
jgi:hypothetical protein